MKKLFLLIIAIAFIFMGCVTTETNTADETVKAETEEIYFFDGSSVYKEMADGLRDTVLDIPAHYDIDEGGTVSFSSDFYGFNGVASVDYKLEFFSANGSGTIGTYSGHLDLSQNETNLSIGMPSPPTPVGGFQYTELTITFQSGDSVTVHPPIDSQDGMASDPDKKELPWYMNPELVELNVNDSLVYFINTETGEEFPLIEYTYSWEALPNEGFKMNITFNEVSGTIWLMEFGAHFAEKRNNLYGGSTGRNAELKGEAVSFYFEDLNPRYPVEKFIMKDFKVQLDDSYQELYKWYDHLDADWIVWENPFFN